MNHSKVISRRVCVRMSLPESGLIRSCARAHWRPGVDLSARGAVPWRVIVVQLVVVAGIITFFSLYLPHRTRVQAQRAVVDREQKINDFFRNTVKDDLDHEVSVPVDGEIVKRHPQVLTANLSPQDVESQLGAPGVSTTDFRGGEHLTWIGTANKLVASFDDGRLYCLTLENRATGHGVMVYQAPDAWHPY
jgi:hypothetical protein